MLQSNPINFLQREVLFAYLQGKALQFTPRWFNEHYDTGKWYDIPNYSNITDLNRLCNDEMFYRVKPD